MRSSTRRTTVSPARTARTRCESIQPFGDAAVRGQPAVQGTGGSPPYLILGVLPHHRAQPFEVEKKAFLSSSAGRKVHSISSITALRGLLALPQLEPPPDSGIPPGRQHPPACGYANTAADPLDARHGL